jgi:hypothetical protein
MADFYLAQCSKRTSQNLASTYYGHSPQAASSMAAGSKVTSGHPAPWRSAPSWHAPWRSQGILLHGGLLQGGLSMVDLGYHQRYLLHGRFGMPSKVAAAWQIWAAIKGVHSMADLGCHQRWPLHGRFGLPSKVAPGYLS